MRDSSLNPLHKVLILSPIFLLLTWTPVSDGRPFRLAKLPDGGANFGCGSCHIDPKGGGPRNAFGEDYNAIARPAGDVYTAELGQTDSDGDGFSNDDESNANPPTKPWDSDSHPPVEPHRKTFTVWARLNSLRSVIRRWSDRERNYSCPKRSPTSFCSSMMNTDLTSGR